MSQEARNRRTSRRLRLVRRAWPTLLLGLLLLASFTWGGLTAESEGELNLAQGREPVATTNTNGEVFVLWESPQHGLAGQALDAWGNPRGQEFPIPGLVGGESRPAASWIDSEQVVIAWESPTWPSGVRVQEFEYELGPNTLQSTGEVIEIPGARYPALAADGDGFAVAWTSVAPEAPTGQHFVAFFERSAAGIEGSGRRVGINFRVGAPGAMTPSGLAVAEGTGATLLVWEDAGKDIMAAAFENRVRVGINFRINTSNRGRNSSPTVAATLDGNFVVVWECEFANGRRQVNGSRVASWGKRVGINFLVSSSAPSSAPQRPSLAADPWGRQIVTWSRVDHSGAAILAQSLFLDGTRNGPTFRVDSGDPFPGAPRVTRGGQGTDFVVFWEADEMSEAPYIRARFLTEPYDLQVDE